MRRLGAWAAIVAAALVGAGVAGAGTSAAQKTFEKPTAETTVGAMQAGLWSVAIEGRPEVVMSAPGFLRKGDTFHFRWTAGEIETYRILAVGDDGWVMGELVGARPRVERWLNPARAISIERASR